MTQFWIKFYKIDFDSSCGYRYTLPFQFQFHFSRNIYIYIYINNIYIYTYIILYYIIYIHTHIYMYYILYIRYISSHKWSTTRRVLKSYRNKMSIIYMLSWKQCALPVITTMDLWQLIHLSTWCLITHLHIGTIGIFGSLLPAMCNRTSYAQVHELPQSHRGDNRESALFSW